jgi:hypothetical protein
MRVKSFKGVNSMATTPKLKKTGNREVNDESINAEEDEVYESSISVDENGQTDKFDFLAGYIDGEGIEHKTFTLREMDGRDEEAISKPELKSNSSKVISVLLERCTMSIGSIKRRDADTEEWRDIIKDLYVGDQDYMMIKLRELSVGSEIEAVHMCPACKQELKTFIETSELEFIKFKGKREIPFILPKGYRDKKGEVHSKGIMRLPKGLDREILTPLAKKNLGVANTTMLTRLCKFDDGFPVTEDVMRALTLKDREYLQKKLHENQFGVKTQIEVTCTSCGETFTGNLNATNFM